MSTIRAVVVTLLDLSVLILTITLFAWWKTQGSKSHPLSFEEWIQESSHRIDHPTEPFHSVVTQASYLNVLPPAQEQIHLLSKDKATDEE